MSTRKLHCRFQHCRHHAFTPVRTPAEASDPFVELELGGEKKRTKVIKDNLNPEWRETLEFAVKANPNHKLKVTCYDRCGKARVQPCVYVDVCFCDDMLVAS
jgi:hypothetical protein